MARISSQVDAYELIEETCNQKNKFKTRRHDAMMVVLVSIFSRNGVQFFLRCLFYIALWIIVMVFRIVRRKKNRKRMDKQTEYLMKYTEKDKNGKYPWEYKDENAKYAWQKKDQER